ncbi:MAG: FmdB family zinc ribbon protein [Planctomycetota bacterium]
MPIFEYRCTDCGHVTEFLESAESGADESGADEEHACEECGSGRTEKAFSAFCARSAPEPPTGSCDTCCPGGTCAL